MDRLIKGKKKKKKEEVNKDIFFKGDFLYL